jgi:hypothetical protein
VRATLPINHAAVRRGAGNLFEGLSDWRALQECDKAILADGQQLRAVVAKGASRARLRVHRRSRCSAEGGGCGHTAELLVRLGKRKEWTRLVDTARQEGVLDLALLEQVRSDAGWTLRARWVTLRARWVTLRARWVTLRARWVTLQLRLMKARGFQAAADALVSPTLVRHQPLALPNLAAVLRG